MFSIDRLSLSRPTLFDASKEADRIIANSKKWIPLPECVNQIRAFGVFLKGAIKHPLRIPYRLTIFPITEEVAKFHVAGFSSIIALNLAAHVYPELVTSFLNSHSLLKLVILSLGIEVTAKACWSSMNNLMSGYMVNTMNRPQVAHWGISTTDFQDAVSAHQGVFGKIFASKPELSLMWKGVCGGESGWFIALYHALTEKGVSPDQAALLAGKEFQQGAPTQALVLQGLHESGLYGWKFMTQTSLPLYISGGICQLIMPLYLLITLAKQLLLGGVNFASHLTYAKTDRARTHVFSLKNAQYCKNLITSHFKCLMVKIFNNINIYSNYEDKLPFAVSSTQVVILNRIKQNSLMGFIRGGRSINDHHIPSLVSGTYSIGVIDLSGKGNHGVVFILNADANERSYFFDPNKGLKPINGENHIKQLIEEIMYRYPWAGALSFRRVEKSTWLNCIPKFLINQAKLPFRLGQNFVKEVNNSIKSKIDQDGNMYFKA